jgi:integrase
VANALDDVLSEAFDRTPFKAVGPVGRNILCCRVSLALAPRLKDPSSPWLFPGDSLDSPMLVTSIGHAHIRICRPGSGKGRRYPFPKEFVLHSCRHTMLTRIGEAGADAFTIMKLAGHSSVTVSQRYVHPTPEAVERAFDRLEAFNRSALEAPPR